MSIEEEILEQLKQINNNILKLSNSLLNKKSIKEDSDTRDRIIKARQEAEEKMQRFKSGLIGKVGNK